MCWAYILRLWCFHTSICKAVHLETKTITCTCRSKKWFLRKINSLRAMALSDMGWYARNAHWISVWIIQYMLMQSIWNINNFGDYNSTSFVTGMSLVILVWNYDFWVIQLWKTTSSSKFKSHLLHPPVSKHAMLDTWKLSPQLYPSSGAWGEKPEWNG